jgi:hypothetical protein
MTFAAFETGRLTGSPVEIYDFIYQSQHLRFTSSATPVVVSGNTYVPYAMQRGPIGSQQASVEQQLTVTAFRDFPPAQLFKVQAPSSVVNLTVMRMNLSDPAQTFQIIWIGRVLNAAWQPGNVVQLLCETDLASLKRLGLRRKYQLNCPYDLYGFGCNLAAASFGTTVTSFSAIGRAVTVPALVTPTDNNLYGGGYLTYPSALSGITEVFAIRSSVGGVLQLALTPLGIQTAITMTVFRGCNHTVAVCETFPLTGSANGNLPNYGGTPYIPNINPFAGVQLF